MVPDVTIEVRNGAVIAVYSELPLSVAILDWDHITEPDGMQSFLITDAFAIPHIGVMTVVPLEPPEEMPTETRQVVEYFAASEGQSGAE